MQKNKYLTKPNKYPKKFIQEVTVCVFKKQFMTLSQVVRNPKVRMLIREFNATPIKNLSQTQIEVMDAIFQACVLIDDYNELFFKDIKVKFIDFDEYTTMRRKYPYAKLGLKSYDKKR